MSADGKEVYYLRTRATDCGAPREARSRSVLRPRVHRTRWIRSRAQSRCQTLHVVSAARSSSTRAPARALISRHDVVGVEVSRADAELARVFGCRARDVALDAGRDAERRRCCAPLSRSAKRSVVAALVQRGAERAGSRCRCVPPLPLPPSGSQRSSVTRVGESRRACGTDRVCHRRRRQLGGARESCALARRADPDNSAEPDDHRQPLGAVGTGETRSRRGCRARRRVRRSRWRAGILDALPLQSPSANVPRRGASLRSRARPRARCGEMLAPCAPATRSCRRASARLSLADLRGDARS